MREVQFPSSFKEWCELSKEIRSIVSVNKFREIIFSFIRPKEDSFFAIHDTKGLELLAHLRLNFNEHKFKLYININLTVALKIQFILWTNAVYKQRQHSTLSLALQAAFYY